MDSLGGDIIKRHGTEVYVMSQLDWNRFKDAVKQDHPEMYEIFKEKMNFNLTPIEFNISDYEIGE